MPTEVVPGIPGRAPCLAHLSRNLKRGAEVARVRGWETKRELVRLHCFEGKSIPECARLMGRSYRALHAVWRTVVAEASGERGGVDYRKQVKAVCDRSLRELLKVSLPLVAESAAHGAVALKAIEGLRSLHGIDGLESDGESKGLSLEEIGASVRVVSPLLADKLERVKALGVAKGFDGFKVAEK